MKSGGFEAFSAHVLSDPKVAALRHKVTMSAYDPVPDWPNDRPTRVDWTMKDGQRLSQEVMSARGGPDLPFGPEEIRAKIKGIVAPAYPAMFGILDSILALDADALNASWRETVAGMTDV